MFAEIQLEFLSTLLDCSRNLCRQDDGVPFGNERLSVQTSFAEIQLEFLLTLLDCSRNLCRQDDGVPGVPFMRKSAIITGASSGIGKALAFELARHGFNLFLTARNEAELDKIAAECRDKFKIKTEILAADLSDADSTDKLTAAVSNRKFDVLVNNAGFGVKGDFAETDIDEELKMLNVQLAAMLKLTKAVLPAMLEAKNGKILNVASVYSFAPVPKQSVYSACKSFILNFSSALQNEVKDSGISVTVLCPGITQTEFRTRAGIADKKNSGMTAEETASIAFREMMRGKHVVIPGLQNKAFAAAGKHFPFGLMTSLTRFINNRRGVNKKDSD